MPTDVRAAVRRATERLSAAGVPSPRVDATALAGHVLGLDPAETARVLVLGRTLTLTQERELTALVGRRVTREPLQHLTGRAYFRRLELAVGPGVFVPRPETELAVELALAELRGPAVREAPVVVDLCTGSGAIALAVKDEHPSAQVWAVELSSTAVARARTNASRLDLDVRFIQQDATLDPPSTWEPELSALVGAVDVVVSNPPYIPVGAVPREPEVRDHDPEMALYGGSEDGLAIPLGVARTAAALLRPGGLLVMEHADVQGETLPTALCAVPGLAAVVDHTDLAGRPRHVTARRA